MNKLTQSFAFNSQAIRTAGTPEEPLFVTKDVCNVLGISKYRDALARLDDDEGCRIKVDTPGGEQEMSAVTESGLYSLILRSNKPKAKQFKRWVTHRVLPSIRKEGYYGNKKKIEQLEKRNHFLTDHHLELMRHKLFNGDLNSFYEAQALWRARKGTGSFTKAAEIAGCSASVVSSRYKKYDHYLDGTRQERRKLPSSLIEDASPFELYDMVKEQIGWRAFLKAVAKRQPLVHRAEALLRKKIIAEQS
jgi:prophage antirepressor-like protein